DRVRPHLGSIDALKRERMERLHLVISRARNPVVTCPGCAQPTYVFGDGKPGSCRYCLYHSGGEVAAETYLTAVLGLSPHGVHEDWHWPLYECVECGIPAFVGGVTIMGASDGTTTYACFACGYACASGELERCDGCSNMARYRGYRETWCTSC